MFKNHELIGIFASIGLMALALFLLRVETTFITDNSDTQVAAPIQVVGDDTEGLQSALQEAYGTNAAVSKLVIDDIRIGTGDAVEVGDEVVVHYVGRLENGQEFDSSYNRGEPFTFTVGAGEVIAGWDEGVVGMQRGGQRVLVVPADMAYGERGMGPIPPNATLLFLVEMVAVN